MEMGVAMCWLAVTSASDLARALFMHFLGQTDLSYFASMGHIRRGLQA